MSVLTDLNDALGETTDRALRSLVLVRSGEHGSGTGAIWHADGLIVTNAHVVQHGPVQVVLNDGTSLPARVLARDDYQDLAALAVDAHNLPVIEVGSSRDLQPGAYVMALGNPWGLRGVASGGVVIGMETYRTQGMVGERELLAVDLRVRPGNSGGPLLDSDGRLVGIVAMMAGSSVALAVPVHEAKAFLRKSLERELATAA